MPGGQHSQEFYSETWAEAGHQGPAPGTRPDVPQALGLGRRMGEAVREAPLTSPFLRAVMLGPFTPYGALKPGDSHLEGKKLGHKEAPAQGCWAAELVFKPPVCVSTPMLCQGREAGQKSFYTMCPKTGVGGGGEDHTGAPQITQPSRPPDPGSCW